MKILYCSGTPLAGVCELMARCMNQYYGDIHEARVLNIGPGKHRWYMRDGDHKPTSGSIRIKTDVDYLVDWADVIHCMANVSAKTMGKLDLLSKKVWVFQWHGAQVWPFTNVWDRNAYRFVKWIHIGQGWIERQWEFFRPFFRSCGARVIPNIIAIEDEIHVPAPWEERERRVAYSPSTQKRGVNDKGYDLTVTAMRGFRKVVLNGMQFEKVMREKRMSILGIDEVTTPMYHRSGLEFLAQGVPCICSYNSDTAKVIREILGSGDVPFIQSNRDNLRQTIRAYMKNMDDWKRKNMAADARAWMERYYHPRNLLKRYLDVYES